jgi:hypothetical protein
MLTTGCLGAQTTPAPVPSAYQDIYNNLTAQISAFDAAVSSGGSGSSYPYLNAPQLVAANSNQYTTLLGPNYYSYAVAEQLTELQALGANAVTIHINFPIFYQPFHAYMGNPSQYQEFVSFYQKVAQDVRSRGMKLVVEASLGMPLVGNQVDQLQGYLQTLSFPEYVTGRAVNALTVAELIQPDYMTVMTEPDSEATVSGQWKLNYLGGVVGLVQEVLTVLHNNGVTNVQVGAGVGTWTQNYMEYVQALAALPMDFVDMHIYPINGSYFTNALAAAEAIHAAGKQVGVSECWDFKIRDSELGVLDYPTIIGRDPFSFWAPIDISFLQAIVNFANYKQLAFVSPYWVQYFFTYLDYSTYGSLPVNTLLPDLYTAADDAVMAGTFTPTGLAWQSMNGRSSSAPPATPAAPAASLVGTYGVNLQWTPDTGSVPVSAYNVYRNGSLLGTTSGLVYYDHGLTSGATYTYNLTATAASGSVSAMSPPLVVETVDITAPSVPTNLVVTNLASTSATLNWTPSTGIGGVGGYRILRGTSPESMSIHADVTAPPYTDPYLQPSNTYYYEVESYNPIGVTSAPGNEITVTAPAK